MKAELCNQAQSSTEATWGFFELGSLLLTDFVVLRSILSQLQAMCGMHTACQSPFTLFSHVSKGLWDLLLAGHVQCTPCLMSIRETQIFPASKHSPEKHGYNLLLLSIFFHIGEQGQFCVTKEREREESFCRIGRKILALKASVRSYFWFPFQLLRCCCFYYCCSQSALCDQCCTTISQSSQKLERNC